MATNPNHLGTTPTEPPAAVLRGGGGVAPAPPSGAELLRDCGQLLGDAVRTTGRELSRPAGRRAVWPVALAIVAGGIAARDVVLTAAGPSRSAAAAAALSVDRSAGATAAAEPPAVRSSLREWLDQPVRPPARNPFATSDVVIDPVAESAAESGGVAPEQKSPPFHADGIQRREDVTPSPDVGPAHPLVQGGATDRPARTASASGTRDEQARQVRLQSTLTGTVPTALVDGRMIREGDVVATGSGMSRTSYRVLKIEARRIILEREGIRSEIPID